MEEGREWTTLEEIAATLRRRREERGLTLADAQAATRIRTRYLQALEEADMAALPEPVYIRGFLRAYADYLGLDGHTLVASFDHLRREGRESAKGVPRGGSVSGGRPPRAAAGRRGVGALGPRPPRRAASRWLLAFGLFVGGLYVVGVWPEGHHAPSVPPADTGAAQRLAETGVSGEPGSEINTGEGAAEDGAIGSGAQTAGTGTAVTPAVTLDVRRAAYGRRWEVGLTGPVTAVEVVIRTSGRCWVRAEVDGRPAYEGVLSAGEERRLLGSRSVALRLGNPGVATLTVNGSLLPSLGGEPVDVVVSAASGAGAAGTASAPGRP